MALLFAYSSAWMDMCDEWLSSTRSTGLSSWCVSGIAAERS